MKRFTLIVALVLMVTMPTFAERVTPETARKVATTFLNNNGAKSDNLTDLSKVAGFPNLYIFNAEQGFVVMAADDCVQPILGYSFTGKFVTENMPTNVSGWLQGYNDEIQYAIDSKMKATNEAAKLWKDLSEGNAKAAKATTVVNALVQTQWDQNGYYYNNTLIELYNNLCPYDYNAGERTVTGCVATAMAQIMKYWDYPSQGIGSHSYTPSNRPDLGVQSANFGATTYQWADMPNKLSRTSTTTQINAVATLMYHCGVSVDMMYDIGDHGGSGAYAEDVPNALIQYFNYKATANIKYKDSYSSDVWISMLKTELNADRPIQYGGSGTGGHSFICDGYDSNNKFHFNWGWSGSNDGYYTLTNLNPGSGGAGGGGYVFNDNQSAIFGIEPGSTIAAPTNLTYTLSGLNDITLTWDGVSAALSYNVYCDGTLVGNTTATTYSETTPFGTHEYYVRCVDANSQLSLPSNTVTVTIAYQTPIVTDLTATLSGNNANLTWTAPEWCYPETPSATLTYGDGNFLGSLGYNGSYAMHWGHRYLANSLTSLANKILYKISFYSNYTGNYEYYIYIGTIAYSNGIVPQTQIAHGSFNVSTTGWFDIELLDLTNPNLNEAIRIDASQDLWVIIYDPEMKTYPASYGNSDGNEYGSYYSAGAPTDYLLNSNNEIAWLINTYLTDGTYTYNLYDGTSQVASNINTTTYTVNNIANNTAHRYTLKTNFNGGLTDASNLAGLTLGNATLSSLAMAANDEMTITEGSKLTINGTLSDVNADNLILENGAQLVNNSTGVKATVKKTVTHYTTNEDGWNFIASPVTENITPSEDNVMFTNNFDLYTFDQSQAIEWRNYKANSFAINHKTGYLYANNVNTTLSFAGTLDASTEGTPLVYDDNATFKGFNLIGNPYPCNTTISRDFYIISGNTVTLAESGRQIAPCEGVFVKASGTNEAVTFTKVTSATSTNSKDCFDMVVAQGRTNVDRARMRLNDGIGMEKFSLDDKHSRISFQQNGQDFAVAYANGANEMPVSFKASQNGTYTLSIESESLDLDYLHLIDNLTGNDIDLLALRQAQGPASYTFEAKTTDYESRFKLVFVANEDGPSTGSGTDGAFAFISDGNIVVNQEGSVQIVDMTGRVVYQGDAIKCKFDGVNRVSTANMTAGVYVLRLINGEKVQTQKIVLP